MTYDPIYYFKKYKWHLLGWGVCIIGVMSFIGFSIWQQQQDEQRGKLPVQVKAVPSHATITIDNTPVKPGTRYVTPGTHTITVSAPGFATTTNTFYAHQNHVPRQYIGLAPQSDEAKRWYNQHRTQYAELERIGFREAQAYGEKFQERWPIVKSLPIKDPYYTISYRHNPDESITLIIKGTSPRYRMFALSQLRKKGVDPTEYAIEFSGFTNPLEERRQ